MLTFRQLEAFKAVMDAGTVVRAAEQMRLSQPAVSRLLSDLETGIGLRLFDRRRGRLTPRQEALELSDEVDRCFVGLDRIAEAAQDIRSRQGGHLRLAALPGFAMGAVSGVVAQFICQHPDITLSLELRSRSQILAEVADNLHDIGLCTSPIDNPAVGVRHLKTLELMCLVPSGHALSGKDVITPQDLDGVTCILGTDKTPTRMRVEQTFKDVQVQPHLRFEVGTIDAASALVAQGIGVSIMISIIHDHAVVPGIRAIPYRSPVQVDLVLVYPANRSLDGAAADLAEMYETIAQTWRPKALYPPSLD